MGIPQFTSPVTLVADIEINQSNADNILDPALGNVLYNGTRWDRMRGTHDGLALARAVRSSGAASANITNYNKEAIQVILRVYAAPSSPAGPSGLTVCINAKSGTLTSPYVLLQATTKITAVGTYVYEVGPGSNGAGVAGNLNVQQRVAGRIPRIVYIGMLAGNADDYEYEVEYSIS